MRTRLYRASVAVLAALSACDKHSDVPATARTSGAPIVSTSAPGVIVRSPDTGAELMLASGDSAIDVAALPTGPDAVFLVRAADGRARVMRWHAGASETTPVAELPAGFVARGIAAHPNAATYFVTGAIGGKSQILAITAAGDARTPTVVFETPREIGRLIVSPRPYGTSGGVLHRLFFAAKLAKGGSSLRSVTERGTIEYQVVGPSSEAVKFEDEPPGGVIAPFGVPLSMHPRGEPLLWQDARGCVHSIEYAKEWVSDSIIRPIPCGSSASILPNGHAYLQWRRDQPGVSVLGMAVATPHQATGYSFVSAPVSVPDGRGVIGFVPKPGSRTAIAYVPLDVPLADVANAWQHVENACDAAAFTSEGGLFRDTEDAEQLYSVYDRLNYSSDARAPFLATTDLFWDNFGAAFNGVFILAEQNGAMGEFWSFVDSAKVALATSAPSSAWARAFAAIAGSRHANATGESQQIASGTTAVQSTVLDAVFDFGELLPRGHYTSTPEMKQYFRAVHYLTSINRRIDGKPLASLPASVHQSARRWIDVYRPFIAPPRASLVWNSGATPFLAPYAKHPTTEQSVFPLSWGLDNEVLASTVYHDTWPLDEQIAGTVAPRLHPSGLDVALVYGNPLARTLLGNDLVAFPNLGPVTQGIRARRPAVTPASSVYERWLDALGSEWADSTRFPGAPSGSRIWDAKRLQTGLASWATLREATILVNERADAAEAGEGGFEELIAEAPRGYVEPAPKTFRAIAGLYESLARTVEATASVEPGLRSAIVEHLKKSAVETHGFEAMAERELRGESLTDSNYAEIQGVAGSAEHQFLIYKSLGTKDNGIPRPDPIPKIADVAGDPDTGVLEVAVGHPLEWRQVVPYFGRREIVVGSVYSYHEFVSNTLYDNTRWRKEVGTRAHPPWIQPLIVPRSGACHATASR